MKPYIKASADVFMSEGFSEFESYTMARKLFYPPFVASCKASTTAQVESATGPYADGPYWYENISGEDI